MPGNEKVMNAKGSRVKKSFLIIGFSDNQGVLYKWMALNNKVYDTANNRAQRDI
jgi:hypothetical protein